MSQQLSKFQIEVLQQLSQGPAIVAIYHKEHESFDQLDGLATMGLTEDVSRKVITLCSPNFRAVMITETGIAFCRNSGSNMVH